MKRIEYRTRVKLMGKFLYINWCVHPLCGKQFFSRRKKTVSGSLSEFIVSFRNHCHQCETVVVYNLGGFHLVGFSVAS